LQWGEDTLDHTILIVDDSPYIVDGLVALLKRKGYNPIAANGGDEAIAILTTGVPDLILLDIMMEPMDGWETLDRIKANPATRDIPVLMFSAKKITSDEARDHRMNIEDFVSKPVSPAHLLESIQRIFERRADVEKGAIGARDAGIDQLIIDEYASLRKGIDVDKNLLAVLKNSSGMNMPGRDVSAEDLNAIKALEEKIQSEEKRLAEIAGKFTHVF